MKNKIIQILKITPEEYDERIFAQYMEWCQKRANSNNNLQELLANAQIDRWFFGQLAIKQREFVEMYEHFPKAVERPEFHYNSYVNEIFSLYPKPLIDAITHKVNMPLRFTDEIYIN